MAAAVLLAACVTHVPTPADVAAKRFETVPDKAVVYIYRNRFDAIEKPAAFMLDENYQGASYRATYFRFEMAPGRHRLAGYAGDNGRFDFSVDAGKLYFILHLVGRLAGLDYSVFRLAPPEPGRQAVLQYELNND